MSPSDILNAAANRLREKGWIQGGYAHVEQSLVHTALSEIGPTDIVGAIRVVDGGWWNHDSDDAKAEAKEAVRDVIGGGSLGHWNDEEERTIDEVIGILKLASERCKAERFSIVHVIGRRGAVCPGPTGGKLRLCE